MADISKITPLNSSTTYTLNARILGQTSSTEPNDKGGLTWNNLSGVQGTTINAYDTPSTSATWWYILRNRHTNTGNNYYTDLAIPFNANSIYYKRVTGSTGSETIANASTNNGWVQVLDQLNYNNYAPTKTGGGASGTWGINITGSSASCTGNAATATKLSNTPNNAAKFLRGDNAWTNTLDGPFVANGSVTANGSLLRSTAHGNTVYIGSQNESYCHISNGSNIPFYFNKTVYIDGQHIQYSSAVTSMSWINGRDSAAVRVANFNQYHAGLSMKTTNGSFEIGVYTSNNLWFTYCPDAQYNAGSNTNYKQCHMTSSGQFYGAVWNDYAEMRNVPEANDYTAESPSTKFAGRCVRDVGDGTMILTTERLQRGGKIVSDTFGFNIGETEDCKTPIAVSGRALVYIHEGREVAASHIGWPVGTGPDGTVSIMTEEEEEKYPSRIVGTISEIPNYKTWGDEHIAVNGRIWIYVK